MQMQTACYTRANAQTNGNTCAVKQQAIRVVNCGGVSQSGGTKTRGKEGAGRDGHRAEERSGVLSVLAQFNLLHRLTQRGTVTGTVLAHDSNLRKNLAVRTRLRNRDNGEGKERG